MSKKEENEFIEISLSKILIPVVVIIVALIALFVFSGGKDNGEEKDVDVNGSEMVFDDPNIVVASLEIDVTEGTYVGDLENAKYAIVEFSDYQCPFCQKHSEETFPILKEKYIDDGDLVYFFREVSIYPPNSTALSLLGQCIYENEGLDEYLSYRKKAYETSFETNDELLNIIGVEDNVRQCFDDETYLARFEQNSVLSRAVGVQGVPGFVVGTFSEDGKIEGFLVPGAYPFSMFEDVLNYLKTL